MEDEIDYEELVRRIKVLERKVRELENRTMGMTRLGRYS